MRHLSALVLLGCGVAVLLLSALSLVVLAAPYARLHALAPATSLGLPLIALALALETGAGRTAIKLLFIALLSATAGPVTSMAIGRSSAQEEGLVENGPPT
ncbi:monovalent cation/H(+) antiporter subunit G [Streptomyces sp. NPDC102437]|uniref:monovalent cation/H(+) antiporter subunit G n=1 Tax=Streptomyces sp. NPDC102437 TaxID=3366175 RepID=UPI00380067F4